MHLRKIQLIIFLAVMFAIDVCTSAGTVTLFTVGVAMELGIPTINAIAAAELGTALVAGGILATGINRGIERVTGTNYLAETVFGGDYNAYNNVELLLGATGYFMVNLHAVFGPGLKQSPADAGGKLNSVDDITNNPQSLYGQSKADVANILGDGWTEGTYGSAGTGWKFTNGDQSIFYHPEGGIHGGSYYGYSSGVTGRIKIVSPGYIPFPGDKATIIPGG